MFHVTALISRHSNLHFHLRNHLCLHVVIVFLLLKFKYDGNCKEVAARALLRELRSGCDVHGCDAAAPNAALLMPSLLVSLHYAHC